MMTERTNQDQEATVPLAVDLQSAAFIADELLRISPPYTGPKDSEATVEQNAAYLLRRLVQRLRKQPDPKELPPWCGLEIKTSDALPRGYIWLHSATEGGDPTKDEPNAFIKGVS